MKRLLLIILFFSAFAQAAVPTYVASGAFAASTTVPTCAIPAGVNPFDILLLVVESENQAISLTTANGFVEVTNSPQSAGTAATDPANRIAVYWKRAIGNGNDANPVPADSGDHTSCQVHAFRGVIGSGNPWDVIAGGNDSAANDTTAVIPGATTTVANDLVVLIQGTSNNATGTANCGAVTNADLTSITERTDNSNTAGLGGGHCLITGTKATAGAYTTSTLTMGATTFKGAMSIALQPPASFSSGTATVIQRNSESNSLAQSGGTSDTYVFELGETTQAGNAIVVAYQSTNADGCVSACVTDDQSNTYWMVNRTVDGTNGDNGQIWIATNVAAGARVITVHFSAGGGLGAMGASALALEVQGLALDPSQVIDVNVGTAAATSTTASAGSFTPTVSGDFLLQCVFRDGGTIGPVGATSFTKGSQANITWQFGGVDLPNGQAFQYGTYNSTSAINPTLTMAPTSAYVSVAAALKTQSGAGAAPSATLRAASVQHVSYFSSPNGPGYSSPATVQWPTEGHFFAAVFSSGSVSGPGSVTSITDSNSNTWVCRTEFVGQGDNGVQICYALNPTPSADLSLTVTMSDTTHDNNILFYDITGSDAASLAFDTDAGAGATISTTGTTSTADAPDLTPTTATGVIFAAIQQINNTLIGATAPAGVLFDAATASFENLDGPQNLDQNGGWAHYYNSSTSLKNFTWTWKSAADAQSQWTAGAAAFKVVSAGAGPAMGQRRPIRW
jgi:hypothetical protein